MCNERERLINTKVICDVMQEGVFNLIKHQSPVIARMMLQRTVAFLLDNNITDLERCLVFAQILQVLNNKDDRDFVISAIMNSSESDLYVPLLLEYQSKSVPSVSKLEDSVMNFFMKKL